MGINWENFKKIKKDKLYSEGKSYRDYEQEERDRIREERRPEAERTKQLAKTDYTKIGTTQKPQVTGMLSSNQNGATVNTAKNSNGNNLWDNVLNIAKGIALGKHGEQYLKDKNKIDANMMLGGILGVKQSARYLMTMNEDIPEYKKNLERQYVSSPKIDKTEKMVNMALKREETDPIIKKASKQQEKSGKNIILPTKTINVPTYDIGTHPAKRSLESSIQKDQTKIANNSETINNPVMKKMSELAPSIGQMGVGMAVNAVSPGLGTMYFSTSASGGYLDEAKERGMNDKQALVFASVMGQVEGTTEAVTVENFHNAGLKMKSLLGKEVVEEAVKEGTKTGLKSALKDYGIGIGENFVQEALIVPASEATATIVGGKDKANWDNVLGRMLQDGIDGALVAVITGGAELGIQSCVGIAEKSQNGQTVTQEEYAKAIQDASKQMDIKGVMKDSMNYTAKKYINYNLQQNQAKNQSNIQGQQITQPETKMSQNSNMLRETATQEINNSKLSNMDKQQMLEALNSIENVTDADLTAIRQTVSSMVEVQRQNNQLPTKENYKTSQDRRAKYVQYKNDTNSYDSTIVDEVVDTVPTNRNGNRTVKQWLGIANEIGKRISDKSNAEIEQIAYKSWFELQPSKSITKYDNQAKQNVGFQRLTTDEWVNTINKAVNENRQQSDIAPIETKYSQQESKVNLPVRKLTYDESVKKYNIDGNNETVKSIKKVLEERGIQGRFDDTIFTDDIEAKWIPIKNSDGTTTREVVFNPKADSTKILQNLLIHELTHDLEGSSSYNKIRKLVLNDAITKKDYLEARKALEETYSKVYDKNKPEFNDLIDSEVVAHILGNKLGDQDFVNRLVKQDRTTMQKIYDWIVDKLNKLTGYSNEKIFWEDVKRKFEVAYNEEYKGNNTSSKLSIQTDAKGNKYVKVDTDQNIFEGIAKKDYNKIAKMYIQDYLLGETNLSGNDSAEIDSRSAKKYTNPGKKQQNFEEKMKLTPELRNVLEIAQKDTAALPSKDSSKYKSWEYYKFNFELSGKNFEGTVNIGIDSNGNKHFYEINKIKEVTDISGTSLNRSITSSITSSITPSKTDVNPKYSMQESDNNSGSFNLQSRLSGDELLNAQDLIEEIQSVGGKVDENGYVTVYHRTNKENAEQIRKTGKMSAKEDGIFFSTSKDGYNNSNYGESIVELKVPVEKLVLDDIFTDEASVKIPLKNRNEIVDVSGYLTQKKIDNTPNLPVKDSKGNILSKEQQNYFKDSKARDSKGNLEKVYHGTNKQGFTEFNRNVNFFTNNKNVANTYTSTDGIYEGYINITKPTIIEANGEVWSKIDVNKIKIEGIDNIKDFLDTYGASTWKEQGTLRTSTADLVSAIADAVDEGVIDSDGIIIKNIYDEGSYSKNGVGKELGTDYITFKSNQFKNIDNTKPTTDPDIRYSKSTGTWQEFLDKNYPNSGKGKTMQDVKLPIDKSKVTQQPSNEIKSSNTTSYNLPISENTKQRKHYKSIIESSNISDEAKKITKELIKADTYVPESNKKQLANADSRIETAIQLSGKEGIDAETTSLLSRAMNGEKITADDIALGERLIQYYSKTGDKAKLQEAIQATAMAGTTAGQTVQALSLLNHQTPEGQAIWLQRSVDKMNKELVKKRGQKAEQFNLTDDMLQKIANSKNSEELHNNLNEVYAELGQQVSKTTAQKIDAWRYFSMLANPRTHIRNIVGNTAMAGVQGVKNKVAGAIEYTVSAFNPNMERTHTIKMADKKIKEFAKNDIKNVADRLELNDNKYNPKTRLENSMRTFKSDVMENTIGRLFNLNDSLLEAEDGWGLKAGYKKALSEYIVANNLDINNISDKELAKARNYAVEQAKEATFHQASSLASALNQFQNKNGLTKFISDAVLPFKKTPINVAKAGIEYSPVGLAKSAILDTIQLRKGNITVNKYIDNISKGLTGTGIAVLGYALADAGILKASGGDDEDKEQFDEARGSQTYSIQIGDNTYSLDWLAPSGIPLFLGAEVFELKQSSKEKKSSSTDEDSDYNQFITSATNILDSFTNAMNPMTEMSMLSGLTSALKSYDQGSSQMLASIGTNAVKSYVNQFVPTALGQVAKTTDEYERSTTSTKTGVLPKAIDTTKNQVMSKVPGLRQMLPIKTDTWGNEIKQNENIIVRALENSTFPWTRKEVKTTDVDKFILDVYDKTGERSVLPDSINKTITIDGQKYTMTSKEYAKYKQQYGQNSYELLESLRQSNSMESEEKQFAIEKIYAYAKEQIKIDYAKENGLEYEESNMSRTTNELKAKHQDTSDYFSFLAVTKDMEKDTEKKKILANAKYTNTTKQIIYKNTLGKDDSLYNNFLSKNININEYLRYKVEDGNEKFKSDEEKSAKQKRLEYVNNPNNVKGYNNRLAILGKEYKLNRKQQTELRNLIEEIVSEENRLEVYKKYSKNFTIEDGKVYYK